MRVSLVCLSLTCVLIFEIAAGFHLSLIKSTKKSFNNSLSTSKKIDSSKLKLADSILMDSSILDSDISVNATMIESTTVNNNATIIEQLSTIIDNNNSTITTTNTTIPIKFNIGQKFHELFVPAEGKELLNTVLNVAMLGYFLGVIVDILMKYFFKKKLF